MDAHQISNFDTIVRFEKYFIKSTVGCWEWLGGKNDTRYGAFNVSLEDSEKQTKPWSMNYAHRVSYRIYNGPIPEGEVVRHTCDNRGCVRPDHLIAGSHGDNMQDMKDRGRSCQAVRHGATKLTIDDVNEIRSDPRKQREIATDYAVCRAVISHIKNDKYWHPECQSLLTAPIVRTPRQLGSRSVAAMTGRISSSSPLAS